MTQNGTEELLNLMRETIEVRLFEAGRRIKIFEDRVRELEKIDEAPCGCNACYVKEIKVSY